MYVTDNLEIVISDRPIRVGRSSRRPYYEVTLIGGDEPGNIPLAQGYTKHEVLRAAQQALLGIAKELATTTEAI